MAPVLGLEPRKTVLETVMLPLHHTDMAEGVRFELTEDSTPRTFSKRVP